MVVTNRSIKSVILPVLAKRAAEAKKERKPRDIDAYYDSERDPIDGRGTAF